jgi:hypothetical protein
LVAALVAVLLTLPSVSDAATRRTPTLAPSDTVVDGPSTAIISLDGLAVARDGTGGLVYLKDIGGVAHVFVSSLEGGAFQPPVQLDHGLAGASSQPVIAATYGGLALIAFINAGELYAVERTNLQSGWSPPVALWSGAANPSLSMSTFGKAYLAFTANRQGGHDVRASYFNLGRWSPAASPLDVNPADDAGVGSDAPQVATSGDGTAIVAWGENGHIYTRRVLGTAPSIAYQQADPSSVQGSSEVSATDPQVSTGGDSSYAAVAFVETVAVGGAQQTRVVVNRLQAGSYDGALTPDGLATSAPEGSDQPRVAVTEFGAGFVTSERNQSHNLFAMTLGQNVLPEAIGQVNTLPQQSDPYAVPAPAGTVSNAIAWQQDPGSAGLPEIRLAYAPDGSDFNLAQAVSSPTLGPTDAARGLFAAGDLAGDTAVAWVQGHGSQTRIVAARLFQAPGSMTPAYLFQYSTSPYPILAWSRATELWGAPNYVVKTDGAPIANTTATLAQSPIALAQGRHAWQVTAVNLAGITNVSRVATVFVDSLPPRVLFRFTGRRHVRSRVRIHVSYTDVYGGIRRAQASGTRSVKVRWGDGATSRIKLGAHVASHAYRRRRTYTVTVIAVDKAGNQTVLRSRLKITRSKPVHFKRRHHTHRG